MKSGLGVCTAAILVASLSGCVPPGSESSPEPSPTPSVESAAPVGPVIELDGPTGNIVVTIDPAALGPAFYSFVTTNPDDPYYLFHTEESDLFLSVELYTKYGAGWTGQLGTFDANCTTNGICIYLDVDGVGPLPALGPAAVGQVTIDQLDGGYDLTLTGIAFDGYSLATLTLVG